MRTPLRALTIAVVVGALASTTVASGQQEPDPEGTLGIRLLDAPVSRRDDPRAQIYIVDHVEPGATVTRRVELVNRSDQVLRPTLYAAPAEIRDGRFVGGNREDEGRIARWTQVVPSQLSLAPGESAEAIATIAVPADASGGEFYGVVWAEISSPDADVTVVNRVGVRIYLSVGGGEEPESDFEIRSLRARRTGDGTPQVIAQVANTGERALDIGGSLLLDDGPDGLRAGPFPAELGTTIGVGATEPVVVNVGQAVPAGPWSARLTLRSGRIERVAEATITFPDEPGTSGEAVPAREVTGTTGGLVALAVALLLLLLLLGALLWFLIVTRRRRREEEVDDGRGVSGRPGPG